MCLIPVMVAALANPITHSIDEVKLDILPFNTIDNTPFISINDPLNTYVGDCASETSGEDIGISQAGENLMRKRGATCHKNVRFNLPRPSSARSPKKVPKTIIARPSKANDRCPQSFPIFLTCAGPEIKEQGRVDNGAKYVFSIVVNCIEGGLRFCVIEYRTGCDKYNTDNHDPRLCNQHRRSLSSGSDRSSEPILLPSMEFWRESQFNSADWHRCC